MGTKGKSRWTLTNDQYGTGSNTLLIHGGRTTWEGNIAYNDNHITFETRPDPETTPFTFNNLPAGRYHLVIDADKPGAEGGVAIQLSAKPAP